jgi:molybdenum cofactor cytidylyltransferase
VGSNVSAILLAAGLSQRMGTKKQLLPVQGLPAVVRCLESLRDSQVSDVVIVVNPEGDDIVNATKEFPVKVAVNELPGSDMAASVKAGMVRIDDEATGILICLCDHPLVLAETLKAILSAHAREPEAIIIPVYRGRKGHPTLFPRFVLEDFGKFATLRDVIGHHHAKVSLLDVGDEGVILDMDTPEDYRRMRGRPGS